MHQRIVSIWFPHLMTDRLTRRQPDLKNLPFVLAMQERNRRVVKAVNKSALQKGIYTDMVVADCKALVPDLKILEYDPSDAQKTLAALAEWCIRYSPSVAIDPPDGLLLDASGCTHLWGGEEAYLTDINARLNGFGYKVNLAMAGTVGAAWGVCRFEKKTTIVPSGKEIEALSSLPAEALRLESSTLERLSKLGLKTVGSFIGMPRTALRRRFGKQIIQRIDQALNAEMEIPEPVRPVAPYSERLSSLEPICTATGIEIALKTLLVTLCQRLSREGKGIRKCDLLSYRVDGNVQKTGIGTNRPSRNSDHLFRLFGMKIPLIEPGLGIELFILEATVVEDLPGTQDAMWSVNTQDNTAVAELIDRLAGRTGGRCIRRFLPAEHYWPERSVKEARSLDEKPAIHWRTDLPRPLHLLQAPEPIEVSVPLPDYPPLLFKYNGKLHTVSKADGPERIEQEWWIEEGLYRDYYYVEDQHGARYWLFRAGDYSTGSPKWFIHGFFA
jgi:protein ImuB